MKGVAPHNWLVSVLLYFFEKKIRKHTKCVKPVKFLLAIITYLNKASPIVGAGTMGVSLFLVWFLVNFSKFSFLFLPTSETSLFNLNSQLTHSRYCKALPNFVLNFYEMSGPFIFMSLFSL